MPLMPGSPRPDARATAPLVTRAATSASPSAAAAATAVDDGVYRSIFQQPQLEIPATAPSYAWFEFLLHRDALQRHLETLRHQNARGMHGATSAMELVREFLDQAQLVADEGNVRNNRYRALLLVAAQVTLQMEIPLAAIELQLPAHFQRLLLDGIVNFAESRATRTEAGIERDGEGDAPSVTPTLAQLLHHRWVLRMLVRESQNGYLTSTNKHDAEEQMSGFQAALSDLTPHHVQIAQSLQDALGDDDTLAVQAQFDGFYDLAVYFFSFNAYEKAYECFSRAAELVEDQDQNAADTSNERGGGSGSVLAALTTTQRASLEGYLAACEAVLESRSTLDTAPSTVPGTELIHLQVDKAVTAHEWETVIDLLRSELVADERVRCAPGRRESIELLTLRLLRKGSLRRPHAGAGTEDDVATRGIRSVYKRIAIGNAIQQASVTRGDNNEIGDDDSAQTARASVCKTLRMLQEESMWAASLRATASSNNSYPPSSLFEDLALYTLQLVGFVYQSESSSASAKRAVQYIATQVVQHYACIWSIHGAEELLATIALTKDSIHHVDSTLMPPLSVEAFIASETALRVGGKRQRDHFRMANDLLGVHAFVRPSDKDAAITALEQALASPASSLPEDRANARNLISLLMLHNCWELLAQWRARIDPNHALCPMLKFAMACGMLLQYVASANATPSVAALSGGNTKAKDEFHVERINKLFNDVLTWRRELLSDTANDTVDGEIDALLIDLPLWLLDALVCVCAGLLHRSAARNVSDHRVSFDLTPYGDLALLIAFAPEIARKSRATGAAAEAFSFGENKQADESSTPDADSTVGTTTLLKTFLLDIVELHARGVRCLVRRCPREPRWHSASADLSLYPIVKLKQPSLSDPRAALRGYLAAASLATNYFSDAVSVVEIIDQSSLVRMSQCLVKVGAPVAAAVLYQCFAPDEFKYGLRILQLAPEAHNPAFFQYFWQLPFLELLVHLHSNPKHYNPRFVKLLTHLIQSPELNTSNPAAVQKDVEQRILRCFFRDLCRAYLS